jgi:transposase-like protein
MLSTHRRYPVELKEEAVKRVVEGREPVHQVCRALAIKPGSVYLAIRKYKVMGFLQPIEETAPMRRSRDRQAKP